MFFGQLICHLASYIEKTAGGDKEGLAITFEEAGNGTLTDRFTMSKFIGQYLEDSVESTRGVQCASLAVDKGWVGSYDLNCGVLVTLQNAGIIAVPLVDPLCGVLYNVTGFT